MHSDNIKKESLLLLCSHTLDMIHPSQRGSLLYDSVYRCFSNKNRHFIYHQFETKSERSFNEHE